MTKKNNVPPNYQRIIDNAWLGIDVDETTLFNPLDHMPVEFEDDPHLYILWLMQQPEYFSFICKEIMNIQLLPVQQLILQEMWNRRFPMLISSRGFGKLIREDEVVRCKNGWRKIKHLKIGDQVYGGNGRLCNIINKTSLQTGVNMCRITLCDGRTIDCCEDHTWKVWDTYDNRAAWSTLKTKDMIDNYFEVRNSYTKYRYALPINSPIIDDDKRQYSIHPYVVGVLLGGGCLTTRTISVTTQDKEVVDKVNQLLPKGYRLSCVSSSKHQYNIMGDVEVETPFYMLCRFVGIYGYNSRTKFIPESYKFGSYDQRLELMRGLMDINGCTKKSVIKYHTVSNKLSNDFLEVARSIGWHCKHSVKEYWLDGVQYANCNIISIYAQPKYDKVFITNIERIGKGNGYCIEVDSPDHTYITKDYIVTHNSFILALYALLRILLLPGRKVVIAGSAFRQSKVVFNYMENIWYNAPLLRDLCGQGAGPRHEPDMFRFHIGDSIALALPIGDGSRIRGQRANDIFADEFAAQSREVFENVIAGFAAVKSSPVEAVQMAAAKLWYKKFGLTPPDDLEITRDNQIVLAGTAYYDFNHFGEYWKRWRQIIRSKGDPTKLEAIFGDDQDGIPENFNWKDYSIIRLPFKLIPHGFMDEAMVARSKATVHSGIYLMEFGACEHPDSLIKTTEGVKRIADIKIGDYVLTHKGRFRKVTKLYKRPYKNKMVKLKTYGYNEAIYFTPEHPFLQSDGAFIPLADIVEHTFLSNLKELSGQNTYVYAQSSHPKTIKLDYNFGLCVGYYASKGSIGSGGNAVSFALDGHINKGLQAFVKELSDALYNVFEIKPKYYWKKDNTISVNINARLVAEIFKSICPGVCYNKMIKHDILFSNKDFMKGFIVGIINGDGYIGKKMVSCQLANLDLIEQIRLVLSYFGIASSLMCVDRPNTTVIQGQQYRQSKIYRMNIFGNNYRKFLNTFYYQTQSLSNRKQNISNNKDCSIYSIKSKELVDFDGYVYNLDIEEDHSYSLLNTTVHNCFSNDSNGFFKRTLIESCVVSKDNEIVLPSGPVFFNAALAGKPGCRYVYGIDPASEIDNFSIVVLEHYNDHRRVVYVWTTNIKEHRERVKSGLTQETDFYSYCARKIRDLMKVFPCERIAIDSQGGGVAIREALHDIDKLERDQNGEIVEQLIWPIIDYKHPNSETDGEPGLHILEMCNFSSASWNSEANHGLRKDFEDKVCIFPFFDSVSLGLAKLIDESGDRLYDTLEDCYMEIEELKNELSTIILTQTVSGRDRWDTPEVKLPGNKKGRLRKDRYSALVMANMISRTMARNPEQHFETAVGGWSRPLRNTTNNMDYVGANWIVRGLQDIYD